MFTGKSGKETTDARQSGALLAADPGCSGGWPTVPDCPGRPSGLPLGLTSRSGAAFAADPVRSGAASRSRLLRGWPTVPDSLAQAIRPAAGADKPLRRCIWLPISSLWGCQPVRSDLCSAACTGLASRSRLHPGSQCSSFDHAAESSAANIAAACPGQSAPKQNRLALLPAGFEAGHSPKAKTGHLPGFTWPVDTKPPCPCQP
jgi:hypothetical protein